MACAFWVIVVISININMFIFIYIYIHIYIRGGLGWGGDVNVLTTASLMLR